MNRTKSKNQLASAVEVVILVPPADPIANRTSPLLSTTSDGHIELMGLFPGAMKLAGEGGIPK